MLAETSGEKEDTRASGNLNIIMQKDTINNNIINIFLFSLVALRCRARAGFSRRCVV